MKQIILSAICASTLSFAAVNSANAATFDFATYIDDVIGEQGYTNTSPFNWTQGTENLTLTATAFFEGQASFVYLDSGNAGMGVCSSGLTQSSAQCSIASDDNITTGEVLTWNFDQSISALDFTLKDTNHNTFTSSIMYSINDGSSWETLSSNYSLAFTNSIDEISFKTIGSASNEQFYMNAVNATVSAVPEPSTYALMIAGLGLVGFMARRRKQA